MQPCRYVSVGATIVRACSYNAFASGMSRVPRSIGATSPKKSEDEKRAESANMLYRSRASSTGRSSQKMVFLVQAYLISSKKPRPMQHGQPRVDLVEEKFNQAE